MRNIIKCNGREFVDFNAILFTARVLYNCEYYFGHFFASGFDLPKIITTQTISFQHIDESEVRFMYESRIFFLRFIYNPKWQTSVDDGNYRMKIHTAHDMMMMILPLLLQAQSQKDICILINWIRVNKNFNTFPFFIASLNKYNFNNCRYACAAFEFIPFNKCCYAVPCQRICTICPLMHVQ